MKSSFFFYKELTPAEVGKTGTHEIYIRLPNNLDYESFKKQLGDAHKLIYKPLASSGGKGIYKI